MAGMQKEKRRATYADIEALPPNVNGEILSPSTQRHDRVVKLDIYEREKVKHAWIVDPLNQTLEVFRLDDGRWTRIAAHAGANKVRAEPFEGIELDLGLLWVP